MLASGLIFPTFYPHIHKVIHNLWSKLLLEAFDKPPKSSYSNNEAEVLWIEGAT